MTSEVSPLLLDVRPKVTGEVKDDMRSPWRHFADGWGLTVSL